MDANHEKVLSTEIIIDHNSWFWKGKAPIKEDGGYLEDKSLIWQKYLRYIEEKTLLIQMMRCR